MGFFRLLSVSALAIGLATSAHAQSLQNARGPANLPPSSFKGPQFVDNRGCIFIRAGHSGRVSWVPRVSRTRKQICGLQPTFATTRTATAARTPKAAPARTTTRVAKAKPKTVVRTIRQPVTTPRQPVTKVRTARAPKTVVRAAPVKTTRVVRQPIGNANCNASAFSSQFINQSGVRCGSQQVSRTAQGQGNSQLVGPKGANRKIRESRMPIPKGYKAAWQNGRLNPLRGVGTTSGKAQMNLVWTTTVPRRLVDARTGKPATKRQLRTFQESGGAFN